MWLEGHFWSKMNFFYLSITLFILSLYLSIIHSYVCTWIRTFLSFMYMYTTEPNISFILIRVSHQTKLVIQYEQNFSQSYFALHPGTELMLLSSCGIQYNFRYAHVT